MYTFFLNFSSQFPSKFQFPSLRAFFVTAGDDNKWIQREKRERAVIGCSIKEMMRCGELYAMKPVHSNRETPRD
jgi:hypothetical protein